MSDLTENDLTVTEGLAALIRDLRCEVAALRIELRSSMDRLDTFTQTLKENSP